MSEELTIYGFGSYFCGTAKYEDIDILIIHRSIAYEACQFAIGCKQFLASKLDKSDITILSKREEQQNSFVAKSSAWEIGKVRENSEQADVFEILIKIGQAGI